MFLLSCKAVVLPIMIAFKSIYSAILKLKLSCLKNVVVWKACAIMRVLLILFLPTSLSAPVTLTVTGVRRTLFAIPSGGRQWEQAVGAGSKDPMLQRENLFFNIIYSRDQTKKLRKN